MPRYLVAVKCEEVKQIFVFYKKSNAQSFKKKAEKIGYQTAVATED